MFFFKFNQPEIRVCCSDGRQSPKSISENSDFYRTLLKDRKYMIVQNLKFKKVSEIVNIPFSFLLHRNRKWIKFLKPLGQNWINIKHRRYWIKTKQFLPKIKRIFWPSQWRSMEIMGDQFQIKKGKRRPYLMLMKK